MGEIGGVHAPGATLTDPDEVAGLIPQHITLQSQLNEWEAGNILEGQRWAFRGRHETEKVLSEDFVRKLHKRMFNKTWRWSGTFRSTEKSIGVAPERIAVDLRNLLEDVKTHVEFNAYGLDEIAARLHHRLVLIHPFPNGNGRHARLFTDVFLRSQGAETFTWGSRADLTNQSETRLDYIRALQAADGKAIEPLLAFVRS
jgi:Fic-DOC domain mobile mystery protein B